MGKLFLLINLMMASIPEIVSPTGVRTGKKPSSSIKLISWNTGGMNIGKSLDSELKFAIKNHMIFTANETNSLPDLSQYKLVGWRHSNPITRGLAVFISSSLRHYST